MASPPLTVTPSPPLCTKRRNHKKPAQGAFFLSRPLPCCRSPPPCLTPSPSPLAPPSAPNAEITKSQHKGPFFCRVAEELCAQAGRGRQRVVSCHRGEGGRWREGDGCAAEGPKRSEGVSQPEPRRPYRRRAVLGWTNSAEDDVDRAVPHSTNRRLRVAAPC